MLLLDKITYQNFFAIESQTVQFRDQGLCVIQGPNGSGKTALYIEGPMYALYGRSFEYGKRPGTKVMKRGTKSMLVDAYLVDEDREIRIIRSRNHKEHGTGLQLFINGNTATRGTVDETQAAIDLLLGMDADTFTTSRMFSTAVTRFPDMSDGDKKLVFEQLLGTSQYEVAGKHVATLTVKATEDKRTETLKVQSATTVVSSLTELIEQAEARSAAWAKDHEFALCSLTAERADHQKAVTAEEERINFEERRTAIRTAMATLDEHKASIAEMLTKVYTKVSESGKVLQSAKSRLAVASADFKRINDLVERKKCASCGQDTESLATDLATAREALRVATEDAEKAKEADDRAQTTRTEIMATERKLLTKKEALQEKEQELVREMTSLQRLKDKLATLDAQLKREESATNPHAGTMDGQRVKLAEQRQIIEAGNAELARLNNELEDLAVLAKVFNDKGAKAYIVAAATPFLNHNAARITELMECAIRVSFRVAGQDESYTGSLQVDVDNPLGALGYHGNSAGERRRVDVVILLSVLALARSRTSSSIGQVFFDESFENLDVTGQECLARVIRDVADQENSTFVITHVADRLASFADKVVTVAPGGVRYVKKTTT